MGHRAAMKEGPALSCPNHPVLCSRTQHCLVTSLGALLPLSENLKANPPGSLPVLGGTSVTPAQAGLRPGSEDAGRRARAWRRLGGVDRSGAGPTKVGWGRRGSACAVARQASRADWAGAGSDDPN